MSVVWEWRKKWDIVTRNSKGIDSSRVLGRKAAMLPVSYQLNENHFGCEMSRNG